MTERESRSHAKRARSLRAEVPAPTLPPATPPSETQLLAECARAVLRATDEAELWSTLIEQLLASGQYREALVISAPKAQRGAASRLPVEPAPDLIALTIAEEGHSRSLLLLRTAHARVPDEGERSALHALAQDIVFSEKRMREAARQHDITANERRLRATFEHAGVGITRIDMNGYFMAVNQKFCEMLGYTRENLIGRLALEITFPEDHEHSMALRDKARSGLSITEMRYLHRNGTPVWVRRTISPAHDQRGVVREVIGVVENISEAKRAEQELRDHIERFELAARATSDVIWDWDVSSGTLWWGGAMERMFGHAPGVFDETQSSWTTHLHPDDVAAANASLRHAVEGAASSWSHEYRFRRADGSYAEVYDRAYIMRDPQGRATRMLGAMMDISERNRQQRERTMEHAVARVLSQSRSVEETMPLAMRTICEAMGWAYAARWFEGEAPGCLRRAEWWADFEVVFDSSDRRHWLELGARKTRGAPLRRAWEENRFAWLTDIQEDANFRRRPSALRFGFHSAYALPIRADGERLGVMEFFGREAREPDAALLQVADAVGNQIGQFIRRQQAEEALQESEQQLRAMFENAEVGISMSAVDMRYLRVNDKFCSLLGYSREALMKLSVSDVHVLRSAGDTLEGSEQSFMDDAENATRETQLVCRDGSLIWVSMATSVVRASDGSPRYFMAVIQDISKNKKAAAALIESEAQFRQLAQYDTLTQLPNRALFYDRLAQALAQAQRNGFTLAVMFVDLDRFKYINDTYGHAAGDLLLKEISRRLSECVRRNDTVGRLSGDEFAVVLSRLTAAEDAATVAQKIVAALNLPVALDATQVFVTASIGITVFPGDSTDQESLLSNADIAMYRAKERGRNNYQFYTPELHRRARAMLSMEAELRRALEREEFVLHYQPRVSLRSGRITGVEALLRWRHPERGLVHPAEFLALLEETGLVLRAGEWVLKSVCEQIKAWELAGIVAVPVAINLSARQFLVPDLAEIIRRELDAHQICATLIEVEFVESAVMKDVEDAIVKLASLRTLGVQTTVDDFGTGYSSLSYLNRFSLRGLKIDRSFVHDITVDADGAIVTQAVIAMAHNLNLKVIAQGVETQNQLSFLERHGCDEVQGYLYSRAVCADECGALISAGEIKPGLGAVFT